MRHFHKRLEQIEPKKGTMTPHLREAMSIVRFKRFECPLVGLTVGAARHRAHYISRPMLPRRYQQRNNHSN